jgi:non-ribosomal peptide synthetase component F
MEPESSFYNVPTVYRLRGALDVGALERTLRELVERHESLRTTLAERDGAAVQVVHPAADLALEVDDLSGAADRDGEARRRIGEEAGRAFDLGRGTLFRARLLRLDAEDHFLVLVFHHAVCDGWSLGVLFGELTALYEAFAAGRPSPLAEPPLQYADFAVWQREHLSGQRLDVELDYWTERLAGAPAALDLPTDHARPPVQRHRGAACDLRVPVEVMHRVRALASREGATLFMAMLAAWQALLGKMSGQDDVVVGSPIAGRTRPELEGVVGFFVNMLALRTDLSGDPTFRQLLARVRETTLGAYQHQELPFERLVQELQGERSLSRNPLVQVVFALHNMPLERPRLARLAIEAQDPQIATAKVDLSLFAAEGREALHLGASFDRDLFDTRTVERLLERFAALLAEVGEHPDRPLSQLAWLTAEERHRLLVEHNATERPVAPGRCVHHLFAEQARLSPHAPAVECGGTVLTYAELDARSNRLAHHLRARGVGPESRVAVLLPPTPDLVVAILGVLKAGGAYLPLDPEHPPVRLDLLLRESGAAVVIVDGVDVVDAGIPALPIGDAAIAGESAAPPAELASPQNLAYVVHTSGSTGTPKGVMIPHEGVVSYLERVAEYAGLTPADTTLQVAPVTFDASVRGLLAPLAAGARVLLPPPPTRGTPGACWS